MIRHMVSVDVQVIEDLGIPGGGARQQTLATLSHQPLAGVGGHVAGHVFLGPGVHQALEAAVQASVDSLVGLVSPGQRSASVHVVLRLENVHHLVGVEFEHALHLQVLSAVGLLQRPRSRLRLLQLLPPSLALPYPPEVPDWKRRKIGIRPEPVTMPCLPVPSTHIAIQFTRTVYANFGQIMQVLRLQCTISIPFVTLVEHNMCNLWLNDRTHGSKITDQR